LKKYFWDYAFLLTIAGLIVLLDQWSKHLVRTNLAFSDMWAPWPWLLPYARIVHWQNTGAAFGMFQNLSPVFTVLAFVVAGAILYFFPKVPRSDWLIRLALALQLGGALGNLVDRLTRGYVTDFLSFGNFAVFNIADSSIFIGTLILILAMWLKERKQENPSNATLTEPDSSSNESATTPASEE